MARDIVLGFDVGATNTRAAVGVLTPSGVERHPAFENVLTTQASSRKALYDFVVSVLRVLEDTDAIEAATFAVAGPIEGGVRARMTNWAEAEPISVEDLAELGLPSGRIALVNDLFAGALGLTAWLQQPQPSGLVDLNHQAGEGTHRGHLVFVAPGTGLGAAGIVRMPDGQYMPVACEVQHTLLPAFDEDAAQVIEQLSAGPSGPPSWEDIASGVGLTRTYLAHCTILGQGPALGEEEGSRAVAEAALEGRDQAAVRTLELYYRVIGRFAQMLALTFQPCEAVYIGGASTMKNREFIERSGLLEQFLANRTQGRLLAGMPLRLVLEELNLQGALAESARLARPMAGVR